MCKNIYEKSVDFFDKIKHVWIGPKLLCLIIHFFKNIILLISKFLVTEKVTYDFFAFKNLIKFKCENVQNPQWVNIWSHYLHKKPSLTNACRVWQFFKSAPSCPSAFSRFLVWDLESFLWPCKTSTRQKRSL